MWPYERGLYETLITEALAAELGRLDGLEVQRAQLHEAEAADRIALHLGRIVERAVEAIDSKNRVRVGISLARELVSAIVRETKADFLESERPHESAEVLRGVLGRLPDGRSEKVPEPLTPLLDTTLLTNAPGEPRVGSQILAEIHSADRIDVVMAFIRRSGIAPLLKALETHCAHGRPLRVLTTTYTGSTEAKALDALAALGAKIRVSYDQASTRLHAKAWHFHRNSGFSTAFIGSSNLTHSAQVTGLEWNVRASSARNPGVVEKVSAVFESYWNSADFVPYDRDEFTRRTAAASSEPTLLLSPIQLQPAPFQERLLEQIALARAQGHHRNLLVSATGTGKTVMAAVDYARLKEHLPRSRLLFVAHREEILTQSLATFRHALRDHSFGELWVRGKRPQRFEHVFASIQSLDRAELDSLAADHFDVIIVDEFHHAAAASYERFLERVQPVELLGLTATPERSDGLDVLHWFDGRIAAELRLWDAIDQHRLVPFSYFGVHDGLDLSDIPWRRGRGYDTEALSNLYTANDHWARFVVKEIDRRVDDISRMRALGFCVSVEHAQFMARTFNAAGIAAAAIWADTPESERRQALKALAERKLNVVFSVDLFNEGVDVPAVDVLLMLRPTDSPTLFLQQLGRGLRRHEGKPHCVVLDFVGHHRQEFRFDRRLRALLGGSRKDVEEQVKSGFPLLPAGCHMELEPVARDIVLESIRNAVPARWAQKVSELREFARGREAVSLSEFLESAGLELTDIYGGQRSWSDLREAAGLPTLLAGPKEKVLRRACGRLLHVDDPVRLSGYANLLSSSAPPNPESLTEPERRLLRMLVASTADQVLERGTSLEEGVRLLWSHPQVRAELLELFQVLAGDITHLSPVMTKPLHVPLAIHARYTRIEILAAFGEGEGARTPPFREGVRWASGAKSDLLLFTLDKSTGHFSPTTRYRDYAISPDLIHWESQSGTHSNTETGSRYRNHVAMGTHVMLFARLNTEMREFFFLGPATYVRHERELPMAVTWKLLHPLPGDLFATFAAAVA